MINTTITTTAITAPAESQQPNQILITVTERTIHESLDGFLSLKITDITDTKNRELVKDALKTCVKLRTTAEDERVKVKEQALAECRRIDAHYKQLKSLIEPVETYLKSQEDTIKQAEKKLEEERLAEIRNTRQVSLENIGFNPTKFRDALITWGDLAKLTDDQFNKILRDAAIMVKAQRDREAEQLRLNEEREKLEAQRREFEKAQQELLEKTRELEELDRNRRREESNARLREEQKQLAAKLAPDHTKLLSVIDQLAAIELPEVSEQASYARTQIQNALQVAYDEITRVLNGMAGS